ncbi:MAG: response regulator transcription factor [Ruminococcaceae bacterium]|nr:response regulator transcription factor [Oscillospiraceae bacterium]
MKRILVCEDENAIREFVVINLKRHGYDVIEAASGESALDKFRAQKEAVDIALLDVMLPGMDGFSVCRELRRHSPTMGIIMLTARTQEADKINGFNTGADDYITKPFSPAELVARVEALYRRVASSKKEDDVYLQEITSGEFVLDLRTRTLKHRGVPLELTQVEFQIMEYFFTNPNKALSRNDILSHVWGEDYFGEEKIVDVNIRRLRMKVEQDSSEPHHIITVWGLGYKWQA